jgi:hypothetical protein
MRCLASRTLQQQSCQTRLTRWSSSRSEQSNRHTTADRLSVLLAFLSDTRMRRQHLLADLSALPWITAAVQGGLTCSRQVHLNAGRQHRHCHGSDIRCLSYILSLTAPASCKARRLIWPCLLVASHCKIPLHPGVRPILTLPYVRSISWVQTQSSDHDSLASACCVTCGVPVLLTSRGD